MDLDSPIAGPSMHALDAYSVPMPVPLPVPLPALTGVIGSVGGPNDAFNAVVYPGPAPMFQQISVPATGHMDAATARSQAREEEMEDEDEWQIREGNAPPPVWAKRRLDEEGGPNKRARSRLVGPSRNRRSVYEYLRAPIALQKLQQEHPRHCTLLIKLCKILLGSSGLRLRKCKNTTTSVVILSALGTDPRRCEIR